MQVNITLADAVRVRDAQAEGAALSAACVIETAQGQQAGTSNAPKLQQEQHPAKAPLVQRDCTHCQRSDGIWQRQCPRIQLWSPAASLAPSQATCAPEDAPVQQCPSAASAKCLYKVFVGQPVLAVLAAASISQAAVIAVLLLRQRKSAAAMHTKPPKGGEGSVPSSGARAGGAPLEKQEHSSERSLHTQPAQTSGILLCSRSSTFPSRESWLYTLDLDHGCWAGASTRHSAGQQSGGGGRGSHASWHSHEWAVAQACLDLSRGSPAQAHEEADAGFSWAARQRGSGQACGAPAAAAWTASGLQSVHWQRAGRRLQRTDEE